MEENDEKRKQNVTDKEIFVMTSKVTIAVIMALTSSHTTSTQAPQCTGTEMLHYKFQLMLTVSSSVYLSITIICNNYSLLVFISRANSIRSIYSYSECIKTLLQL